MSIKKFSLIFFVVLLSVLLISSVKELLFLVNKYPAAFQQAEKFSLIRFYNTYQTLSFSEVMIQQGHPSSYSCDYLRFNDEEKDRLASIFREDYLKNPKSRTINYLDYEITQFEPMGANCIAHSKLIAFEFKNNEAYATFSCTQGDLVMEFSYSSSDGGKCGVIQYKKEWGVQPKRTLEDTKKLIVVR